MAAARKRRRTRACRDRAAAELPRLPASPRRGRREEEGGAREWRSFAAAGWSCVPPQGPRAVKWAVTGGARLRPVALDDKLHRWRGDRARVGTCAAARMSECRVRTGREPPAPDAATAGRRCMGVCVARRAQTHAPLFARGRALWRPMQPAHSRAGAAPSTPARGRRRRATPEEPRFRCALRQGQTAVVPIPMCPLRCAHPESADRGAPLSAIAAGRVITKRQRVAGLQRAAAANAAQGLRSAACGVAPAVRAAARAAASTRRGLPVSKRCAAAGRAAWLRRWQPTRAAGATDAAAARRDGPGAARGAPAARRRMRLRCVTRRSRPLLPRRPPPALAPLALPVRPS
jgi:hypothetical protein